MNTLLNKKMSQEELDNWAKKQEEVNAEYRKACIAQLEEWVKGNSTHNPISPIITVLDSDNKIVRYYQSNGDECCPDFSCCGGNGWSIEKRQHFLEFYKNNNNEACHDMLMGALSDLTNSMSNVKIHIASQIPDDNETKH